MNKFFSYIDEGIKKLRWWDISLVKISVLFFTLALVAVFPEMLSWGTWQVYLLLSLAFALPATFRVYDTLWFRVLSLASFGVIYLLLSYFA